MPAPFGVNQQLGAWQGLKCNRVTTVLGNQGDQGKSGKLIEYSSVQGKVREFEKWKGKSRKVREFDKISEDKVFATPHIHLCAFSLCPMPCQEVMEISLRSRRSQRKARENGDNKRIGHSVQFMYHCEFFVLIWL